MTKAGRIIILAVCAAAAVVAAVLIKRSAPKPESEPEALGVQAALEAAPEVIGSSYRNMVLPESIDVGNAEKAYILYADRGGAEEELSDRLEGFSLAFAGQKPDSVYQSPDSPNTLVGEIEGKYHIEYSASDSFFAYRLAEWRAQEERDPTAVYDLERDDISAVSYRVAEQDYPLSSARQLAEGFIKTKLMEFMPNDTEIRLCKAYVFRSGENYFYCFSGEHYIEGIPLSRAGTGSTDEAHMNGTEFRIYIDEPEVIGEVRNFRYPRVTAREEVGELVTLSAALSYLEEYLAPYSSYEIQRITLEYCSKDLGDSGNSFVYHPVWCFELSTYPTNAYQLEPRRVLYLDAVNKEVFCWDDSKAEFVFGDNVTAPSEDS